MTKTDKLDFVLHLHEVSFLVELLEFDLEESQFMDCDERTDKECLLKRMKDFLKSDEVTASSDFAHAMEVAKATRREE